MYEARDEATREKIRQMIREGKDPESLGNYDSKIRDYQDRSGNMYAIRDEAAREKIRELIRQGKDPESLGNYDRDIRDYQDRCNERNSHLNKNQSQPLGKSTTENVARSQEKSDAEDYCDRQEKELIRLQMSTPEGLAELRKKSAERAAEWEANEEKLRAFKEKASLARAKEREIRALNRGKNKYVISENVRNWLFIFSMFIIAPVLGIVFMNAWVWILCTIFVILILNITS
jgi:regulator of RNase E activity RraB